jgi:hypothetical protein
MNKLILTLTMSLGVNALALDCTTDQECVSASLRLIKQAVKLDACKPEVQAAADASENILKPNDNSITNLEACVNKAKREAKFKKTQQKRIERIQKALKGGV